MGKFSESPRGLIVSVINHATKELDELCEKQAIAYSQSKTRDQFFEDCKTKYSKVEVVMIGNSTVGPYDKEFVDNLPSGVKLITYHAAGYDGLDVEACTARGIRVSNTPTAVDAATADVACLLILSAFRNSTQAERNLREGRWRHGVTMGNDPEGKTLGILGLGGIGKAVAKRMAGFDMKIQYHNRTRQSPEVEKQYNATYVDFETLLRTSDCIFVSIPLNKATYHLLDSPQFTMMKDGVVIVNTARGKVINESALVNALENGKVSAVGLDVFEGEPKVIHPGLLAHPRSVLLPHIGTYSQETMYKMDVVCLQNFEAALTSNTLVNPIPEHKHLFQ
ncbi:D-isomer specific 2-hydroxyacid dehydrogenase [Zychaea mexicana]|uniref:D-isomer specific 2-hydroxyacid dehydrogenase n=1 Tax=Zychaea mexicana TaxID=64656 RepID=UPI0022FEF997|nr:D-isomer specific 2-hydroxyacid dehydrogenase [Zychaea mexicana]KAI9479548.1 D-isomer specific 2-hydroxyacid dehydrogenase [Zychaea mexicana]